MEFCRILGVREHGDYGYVLFDTGPKTQPYLYGVTYERRDGRWLEGISSNGPGWTAIGPAADELGVFTVWGEAPPDAERVRGVFNGNVCDEPVVDGVYLLSWFRVAPDDWSGTLSFRINGQWT